MLDAKRHTLNAHRGTDHVRRGTPSTSTGTRWGNTQMYTKNTLYNNNGPSVTRPATDYCYIPLNVINEIAKAGKFIPHFLPLVRLT